MLGQPDLVPDYCEPILAYRSWHLAGGGLLSSRGTTIWEPYQALEGRHIGFDFEACAGTPCDGHQPYVAPQCGIYGFRSLDALKAQMSLLIFNTGTTIGAVYLWGRIVEHEHGYRAQYAYPAHFIYAYSDGPALAARYGVPYQEDASWKSAGLSGASSQSLFASLSLNLAPFAQAMKQVMHAALEAEKEFAKTSRMLNALRLESMIEPGEVVVPTTRRSKRATLYEQPSLTGKSIVWRQEEGGWVRD